MDIIELEHGVPDPENPGRVKCAGQPTAQEVFEELKYRLESMGYLPDEYFVMDSEMGEWPGDTQGCGCFLYC